MTVEIRYRGGLGNNLYQYAIGRLIAEARSYRLVCIPEPAELTAYDRLLTREGVVDRLPDLSNALRDCSQDIAGESVQQPRYQLTLGNVPFLWDGQRIDLATLMAGNTRQRIVLDGYFQCASYYEPHRERIRWWLMPKSNFMRVGLDSSDVLAHFRRTMDYRLLGWVVSLDYYESALRRLQPRRTVIAGVGIDHEVRRRMEPFHPDYSLVGLSGVETLGMMAGAKRLVLSNSTFAWWGAFLSSATEIIMPRPVSGMWSFYVAPEFAFTGCTVETGVRVERFAPCILRPGSLNGLRCIKSAWTLMATAANGSTVEIPVHERALPFAEWLIDQHGSFGPEDWAWTLERCAKEVSTAILKRLLECGALMIDQDIRGVVDG